MGPGLHLPLDASDARRCKAASDRVRVGRIYNSNYRNLRNLQNEPLQAPAGPSRYRILQGFSEPADLSAACAFQSRRPTTLPALWLIIAWSRLSACVKGSFSMSDESIP